MLVAIYFWLFQLFIELEQQEQNFMMHVFFFFPEHHHNLMRKCFAKPGSHACHSRVKQCIQGANIWFIFLSFNRLFLNMLATLCYLRYTTHKHTYIHTRTNTHTYTHHLQRILRKTLRKVNGLLRVCVCKPSSHD
jgi:hypothetical protein